MSPHTYRGLSARRDDSKQDTFSTKKTLSHHSSLMTLRSSESSIGVWVRVHLIGIGGIGVSALARYFLSQGWGVTGSDVTPSPLLRELKKEGIKIKTGNRKSNIDLGTNLVIYTKAILSDNVELKEARRRKIRTLTYPQALGELTRKFTTVALAGTHGKSTATALTALALIEGKFDPTVIIGTKLKELNNRNFRAGHSSTNSPQKSKYLVVEADEYKDAFLHYSPYAALITNIDREHLDYFKDLNHTKRSFSKFIGNIEKKGILVLNKDSAPLLQLGNRISGTRKIVWYSLKEKKLASKVKKYLKIPGEHNLSNALGVYKLARSLGVRNQDILRAFSKYQGSWRRMEYRGQLKTSAKGGSASGGKNLKLKTYVYDDYAHHPTEIKATLAAFREKFPRSAGWRIVCVFQPHQAERLRKLFKEFTSAFDEADDLILLDIFKVKGRERAGPPAGGRNKELGSRELAKDIQKRSKSSETVTYLPYSGRLKQVLQKLIKKQEAVIVMMGAGDIVELTPRLVSRI